MKLQRKTRRPCWIKVETGWYETDDEHLVLLDDPDIGWTLMIKDTPPTFIGCFKTMEEAAAQAQAEYGYPEPIN